MRWKTNNPPNRGDKKTVKHFAWLPVVVWINSDSNNAVELERHYVWLEHYYSDYYYTVASFGEYCYEEYWKEITRYSKEKS